MNWKESSIVAFNGTQVITGAGQTRVSAPASGSGTLILENQGNSSITVVTQGRSGYVRLTGQAASGDRIQVGNANFSITRAMLLLITLRIARTSQIEGYSGQIELFKTNQSDSSGPKLRCFAGGSSMSPTTYRRHAVMERSGIVSGSPGQTFAYSSVSSAAGPAAANVLGITASEDWKTVGWWCRSNLDGALTGQNTMGGIGVGVSSDRIYTVCSPNVGNLTYWRGEFILSTSTGPLQDSGQTTYAFPTHSNVDFVMGGSSTATNRTFDVARIVKLNQSTSLDHTALMCQGIDPRVLGYSLSADDFVLDFGQLPSICTVSGGAPLFNPAEDGPSLFRILGTISPGNSLSIAYSNGRLA